MPNSTIKEIPPLTKEQIRRLYELSKMTDDEIDYSDIPPLTDEELARMKPARNCKKIYKPQTKKRVAVNSTARYFYAKKFLKCFSSNLKKDFCSTSAVVTTSVDAISLPSIETLTLPIDSPPVTGAFKTSGIS